MHAKFCKNPLEINCLTFLLIFDVFSTGKSEGKGGIFYYITGKKEGKGVGVGGLGNTCW